MLNNGGKELKSLELIPSRFIEGVQGIHLFKIARFTMEIRRPKKDDIKQLHQFFRSVISDTFKNEGISGQNEDLEEEIRTKESYLENDLLSSGKNRYFLIALESDRIIGTIEYGPASSLIITCTNKSLQHLVEVGTVFVLPECQRKGIGNLLMQKMYKVLQDNGIGEFCLDSGYRRAQTIWKRKFGEPDYFLKDFWGENFHHMIWKLNVSVLLNESRQQSR
jgi:GNAT superfamily N-acetyltransferase